MPRVPLAPDIPGNSPTLNIRVSAHQLAALDKCAAKLSIPRSAVMREALDAFFAEEAVTT